MKLALDFFERLWYGLLYGNNSAFRHYYGPPESLRKMQELSLLSLELGLCLQRGGTSLVIVRTVFVIFEGGKTEECRKQDASMCPCAALNSFSGPNLYRKRLRPPNLMCGGLGDRHSDWNRISSRLVVLHPARSTPIVCVKGKAPQH